MDAAPLADNSENICSELQFEVLCVKPRHLRIVADSLVMISIFLSALFAAKTIRAHLDGVERLFAYVGLFAFAFVVFPLIHKAIRRLFKD